MKHLKLLTFSCGLLFMTLSCQKEDIEPTSLEGVHATELATSEAGKDYYYYYRENWTALGKVSTKRVVIGFIDGYTSEQKKAFIATYPMLGTIINDTQTGSADATVVSVKDGYLPGQVETALESIKQKTAVRYATPVFYTGGSFDNGITNQFIVHLTDASYLKSLQYHVSRTNTKIVESLDKRTYILSADKTSAGDALAMSVEFYGKTGIKYSEPDFLIMAASSSPTTY